MLIWLMILGIVLLGLYKPSSSESVCIVYVFCFTLQKLCREQRDCQHGFPFLSRDSHYTWEILRQSDVLLFGYGDDFLEILTLPYFFPHLFVSRSIFQFESVYQSCPVTPFLPQPVAQSHLRVSQCELLVLPLMRVHAWRNDTQICLLFIALIKCISL
jgi:hypothetical protein